VCRNSYVNCKNVMQEFILIFRDMFLCLVWLSTIRITNIKIHGPYCAFLKFLTFRGPCIVIYSYNKNQQDALFLRFMLVKNSACFGQIYRPLSEVLILYTRQLLFAMQLCWLRVSASEVILTSLADSQHNCMTNTNCHVYSVETLDDGR